MAIDFLSQRKTQEKALSDLVSGRNIEDELTRTRSGISALRKRFLGRAGQFISGVSPSGRSSVFSRVPEIDVKTQALLAQRKRALQMQKMQAVFNNAFEMAQQNGMDVDSANEFARNIAQQSAQQAFLGSEAEKEREFKKKLNVLGGDYTSRQLKLEDEFAPSSDYGGALLQVLLGTGTNIALNRYLSNRYATANRTVPKKFGATPFPIASDLYGSARG